MTEQFTAQLSLVDGGAIITQNTATVVIDDNDGKLICVGFGFVVICLSCDNDELEFLLWIVNG